MIGTKVVEELVQAVALSHLVKGYNRTSLLLMAAPESGKTTIAAASSAQHVCQVAVISGRSILKEVHDHPATEFLLFNDLTAVRAMSATAVSLLVVILNQFTQGEKGLVAFAGKETELIERPIGIIACMPFKTFADHRARWREMGFVSRMIPFSYEYGAELVATIKDAIDEGVHREKARPRAKMPKPARRPVTIAMPTKITRDVRRIADAKSDQLGQIGIRLLQNYHCLIRAHALLHKRHTVNRDDVKFLRAVDRFVSIMKCTPLESRDDE